MYKNSSLVTKSHFQNGIACLTLIIRKDCNQLIFWNDPNGRSGLDWVLSLVARMLESQDESGGLQIGDLIVHLFRRAGEAILSVLPQLLQAMVSRMTSAKTATFLQVSKAVDSYDKNERDRSRVLLFRSHF